MLENACRPEKSREEDEKAKFGARHRTGFTGPDHDARWWRGGEATDPFPRARRTIDERHAHGKVGQWGQKYGKPEHCSEWQGFSGPGQKNPEANAVKEEIPEEDNGCGVEDVAEQPIDDQEGGQCELATLMTKAFRKEDLHSRTSQNMCRQFGPRWTRSKRSQWLWRSTRRRRASERLSDLSLMVISLRYPKATRDWSDIARLPNICV